MLTRLAVLGLALGAAVAIAPPAQADWVNPKTQGCVSEAEFDALQLRPLVSRDEMERKWYVSGERVNVTRKTDNIGSRHGYLYRACGFSYDEVQVLVLTERTKRPGYERKAAGAQIVTSAVWWELPPGYVCGDGCTPGGYNDLLDDDDGIPDNYVRHQDLVVHV